MLITTLIRNLLTVALVGLGALSAFSYTPVVLGIPDQYIAEGAEFVPVALDNYVADPGHPVDALTWTAIHSGELSVSIVDRVAYLTAPGPDWFGVDSVIIRATDPDMAWDEDTAVFTVEESSYRPLSIADWPISTPVEQGLDPNLVMETYHEADVIPHLYSWLICANGYLVAEKYYNGRSAYSYHQLMSATKSVTSILAGIALNDGLLTDLDGPIKDYFPDINWISLDPRKSEVTLRQLLQMRSGYPNDDNLIAGRNWSVMFLAEFPLATDPGTRFAYSNMSSYIVGVAIHRMAGQNLRNYGTYHLFGPLGIPSPYWAADSAGYNFGHSHLFLRSRDMARIGCLYANNGLWQGEQIVPAGWVEASLETYSLGYIHLTEHVHTVEYGYQWWTGHAGEYAFKYAWGHGGQLIVLVPTHDLVVVATADPLETNFTSNSWLLEGAVIDLVGRFVSGLGEPPPEGCCVGRVGDANGSGEDEPTISDVSVLVDARFISGTCDGLLPCLTEGDINGSGGPEPTCDDITISDISILIDYLFITGSSLGLAPCP